MLGSKNACALRNAFSKGEGFNFPQALQKRRRGQIEDTDTILARQKARPKMQHGKVGKTRKAFVKLLEAFL